MPPTCRRPTSLGADTRGTWELAFGPSYSRFNAASEDIDALAIFDTGPDWMRLLFSSVGKFSVDGVIADDEDVLEYTWFPGLPTAPAGSIGTWADGLDNLLLQGTKADISALEWVVDW